MIRGGDRTGNFSRREEAVEKSLRPTVLSEKHLYMQWPLGKAVPGMEGWVEPTGRVWGRSNT